MENKRQLKAIPATCRICGASAIYSYFGAIVCAPCKIFFKRNARSGLVDTLKCHFNHCCEINIFTRHICSYCRLVKCFNNGMQVELIRSSVSKQHIINKNPIERTTTTTTVQFPTLNLLQSNLSILTVEQWNIISNLFHSYDEYSGLIFGERYMYEQRLLPYKLRFKCSSIIDIIQRIFHSTQFLYKNNEDFHSLSIHDRSILLQNTIRPLVSLSSNFILAKIGLITQPTYYHAMSMMTHPDIIPIARRLENRFDMDMITMKLFLAILSFSPCHYYTIIHSNLSNIPYIVKIQDKYTELIWRYLLYKYNFQRAVRIFSEFIQILFNIDDLIIQVYDDLQWYRETIDHLIEQIENDFR